jgi:hypothetical protein
MRRVISPVKIEGLNPSTTLLAVIVNPVIFLVSIKLKGEAFPRSEGNVTVHITVKDLNPVICLIEELDTTTSTVSPSKLLYVCKREFTACDNSIAVERRPKGRGQELLPKVKIYKPLEAAYSFSRITVSICTSCMNGAEPVLTSMPADK